MKNAKQSKGLKEVVSSRSLYKSKYGLRIKLRASTFISPDELPLSREMKAIHKIFDTERIHATADHISGDLNAESLGGGRPA